MILYDLFTAPINYEKIGSMLKAVIEVPFRGFRGL